MLTLQMADTIRHQGIVENISGPHIQVRIVQVSACATCSIKGHCTSADAKEKLIDVYTADAAAYRTGDAVWVVGRLAMGAWAVVLAFVLPLLLLLAVLFAAHAATGSELQATGISLVCLSVYYFFVWLNRKRLGRTFSFSIEKQ